MDVADPQDLALIAALSDGLTFEERPYHHLGLRVGMDEDEVLRRLRGLLDQGVIRRFGIIVRHGELGYRANAMVAWQIPEHDIGTIGRRLGQAPEVTLCYRRPARPPRWPYTLFTMIHGRDRGMVEAMIGELAQREGLTCYPRAVLFSLRRFKQCGARYVGS